MDSKRITEEQFLEALEIIKLYKIQVDSQVAEFCGVTFQTINKVEQGKFPYSIDLLMKLSVILEFTINFEMKENVDNSRFILHQSKKKGFWICTDAENQIVCTFENQNFNENQNFSFLNDISFSASKLTTIIRELRDWLKENHPEKL